MNLDRQKSILALLLEKKTVSVKELSEKLYASESTIRRELTLLVEQKLVRRTHGGVMLANSGNNKIPFVMRELEQRSAKELIGRRAAGLVHDNDVIFLDGSSSAYSMIPYLAGKKNLTVVTNGVKAMLKLGEMGIRVIGTGGEMISDGFVMVGDAAAEAVRGFHANAAFFSCRGVSEDGYATDVSMAEDLIRQKMMAMADRSYLLCTKEKFGHKYYHILCRIEKLTAIIDEGGEPEEAEK